MKNCTRTTLLLAVCLIAACSSESNTTTDIASDSVGTHPTNDSVTTETSPDSTLEQIALDSVSDDGPLDSDTSTTIEDTSPAEAPAGVLTYHKDVRPLMEVHCLKCHQAGGAAGFGYQFDSYEQVSAWGPVIALRTLNREMPPWPPAASCHSYQGERLLTDAEIDTFQVWLAEGSWQGDPADYVPPDIPVEEKPEPTLSPLDAGADYTPDPAKPDDYRCLPMTYAITEPIFMTGYDVLPDAKEVVHHILVYKIPASAAADVDEKDDTDLATGYPCGVTPETSAYDFVGSWVPGQPVQYFPEDSGIYLEPGSRFVLQMHYNTLGVPPGTPLPPDRTQLVLYTRPSTPLPAKIVYFSLLADGGLLIPIDATDHLESKTFALPADLTMVGIFPHMHLLGKEIRAYVEHEDGTETCLVDIAKWDFDWQQFFMFQVDEPFITQANDVLHLECIYDNSAANQPVINGVKQEPKTVRFGEGTTDEMCLVFPMWTKSCDGDVCTGLPACMESCTQGNLDCFVACLAPEGEACGPCATNAAYECGVQHCPDEFLIYTECEKGGGDCDDSLGDWYACAEPVIKSGVCNGNFLCCGAQFGL